MCLWIWDRQFTTVIIGRGQEIAFVKQIPIAGDQLNQQVPTGLGFRWKKRLTCGTGCGMRIPNMLIRNKTRRYRRDERFD